MVIESVLKYLLIFMLYMHSKIAKEITEDRSILKFSVKYLAFIVVLYGFTFQFALMKYIPVVGYWDEIFAVMCIPLVIVKSKGKFKIENKYVRNMFVSLFLFTLVGIVSNCVYRYQIWEGVVQDVLLNLKFFMGIATTYFLFYDFRIMKYKNEIKVHAKALIASYFLLTIQNKVTHFFPVANRRFGLDAEVLFFNHPTELAAVTFFLLLIVLLCYSNFKKDFPYIFMGILVIMMTLRFKAIAAAMVFLYIYMIMITGRKMKFRYFIPIIPICLLVGWNEFYFYFFSSHKMDMARGALSFASVQIAIDKFPLGTGFGTFASWPSGIFYSPVYILYGINTVWGLSKDFPAFVSDVFWPMIIAQNGLLGLILYIYIVVCLFRLVLQCAKADKRLYMAGMGALIYLLVSSIAESAFVNPISLPLALVIGLTLCVYNQRRDII